VRSRSLKQERSRRTDQGRVHEGTRLQYLRGHGYQLVCAQGELNGGFKRLIVYTRKFWIEDVIILDCHGVKYKLSGRKFEILNYDKR
jgi:hypothetical protein